MKKYNDYSRGRADGIRWAYVLAEKEGLDALRKEAELRNATGINPIGKFEQDLDARIDSIIVHVMRRVFVLAVAALHDVYGFGPTRMQRFFDAFSEGTRLLMKGRAGGALWTDYMSGIEEAYGVTVTANTEGIIIKAKAAQDPSDERRKAVAAPEAKKPIKPSAKKKKAAESPTEA